MSQEIQIRSDRKVQKRNGQLVAFNASRISNAIANAFKQHNNLPREVELPDTILHDVETVSEHVFSVLQESRMRLSANYMKVDIKKLVSFTLNIAKSVPPNARILISIRPSSVMAVSSLSNPKRLP